MGIYISDPKQQKFYRNLMLSRIKWSDEVAGEKRPSAPIPQGNVGDRNECQLVGTTSGILIAARFAERRFF